MGRHGRVETPPGGFSRGPLFHVHVRRISCSFKSPSGVLFSFPLRYLFAIGHSQSYLALDGQHHPYSASIYKLAYSRLDPFLARPARSHVTPCAPGRSSRELQSPLFRSHTFDYRSPSPVRGRGIRSRAIPFSLAATGGISIDFFSSADLYA